MCACAGSPLEDSMAKRSARRRAREAENYRADAESHPMMGHPKVTKLFPIDGGWRPEARDQDRDREREWSPAYERERRYVKNVQARSKGQEGLIEAIDSKSLVLALGPAGTGKTYLAIAKAVEALEAGRVGRIVLSRPAVEAGESIGFLPGHMEDKLAPYLRPLYDALHDRLPAKRLRGLIAEGLVEIAPVGYMRGRTLNNAFVVIDEAQNCTFTQLKMLLTRLGWHSTMVVTGDPQQTDLLPELSGLATCADKLSVLPTVGVVRLDKDDIVRHPIVAEMLDVL
jgi:phosphate starvation-inducible PhoH-like protein